MFVITPDAWANAISVIVICITIVTVFAEKLEEKRLQGVVSLPWTISQIGSSIIAAYIAWEVHPHITWMPVLVTQTVFTVLAIHGGTMFIRGIRSKVIPEIKE